jgi:uncharacterized protein (DUF4415 family)
VAIFTAGGSQSEYAALTIFAALDWYGLPLAKDSWANSKTSKTDWARVRGVKDKDNKRSSEHPEADVKHIARGIARQGVKPASGKTSISRRVDAAVLKWFRAQGPGYQTRINAVLKVFKDASV